MTKNYKVFLLAIICSTLPIASYAVKAFPGILEIPQKNGEVLRIQRHGDEYYNYTTTEDGYVIMQNAQGEYEYAQKDNANKWTLTHMTARNKENRSVSDRKYLEKIDVNQVREQEVSSWVAARVRANNANKVMQKAYPSTGNPKGLVILVNFNDKAFITPKPKEAFTNLLNQSDYSENGATGSAKDYFSAASHGLFNPEFDVYGPYTLPESMAFYGANTNNSNDSNPRQMVIDACELANADINFADYDVDKDGRVDNVFVYYAGNNEAEGASSNTIWPHRWTINTTLNLDGVRIYDYACTSELRGARGSTMCGIGTFVHEFSHVLGLPDFYATNNGSHNTLGNWDVMDAGPYNNNGCTPPTYSAYERWFCEWLTPVELTEGQIVEINPLITSNEAYIITKDGNHSLNGKYPSPAEFFVLENRQKIGWDAPSIPGKGLIVTRIFFNSTTWAQNSVNNIPSEMGVDIIEADKLSGSSYSGDPFPGTSNITEYSPILRDGTDIEKPLTFIEEHDGIVSFRFMGGGDNFSQMTISTKELSFSTVQSTPSDSSQIIINGTKLTQDVNVSFSTQKHFEYRLISEDSNAWRKTGFILTPSTSDSTLTDTVLVRYNPTIPSYSNTHTNKITFSYPGITRSVNLSGQSTRPVLVQIPVATEGTDVTPYSFTANWEPAFDATGYYLTVWAVQEGAKSSSKEEFSSFDSQVPANWYANFKSTTRLYYNSAPQSVSFSNSNDTIITEEFLAPADELSFWLRGMSANNGTFKVEGKEKEGSWTVIEAIAANSQLTSQTKKYTFNKNENYNQFRFTYQKGQGNIAFDDLTVNFSKGIYYPAKEEFIESTSKEFKDLTPNLEYFYQVKATDKSEYYENITDFSNMVSVKTLIGEPLNSKKLTISSVDKETGTVVVYLPDMDNELYVYNVVGQVEQIITPSNVEQSITNLKAGRFYVLKYGKKVAKIIF